MRKVLFAGVVAFSLFASGCTVAPDEARGAISAMGFTNIELGGYAPFSCGRDDVFARSFTATGADGSRVEGVVCSGFFKGATVRITRTQR